MFVNLNILLLSISSLYECKTMHRNFTEEFINLEVISDYVYIGGKHNLIQLNSSLKVVNIKPMNGRNWLLTSYKPTEEETILIACDYKGEYQTVCIGYRSNLSIVIGYKTRDIKIKKPHARYTTTTIGSRNILTIASSDCIKPVSFNDACFAISNYKDKINDFNDIGTYTVKYLNETEKNKFSFDFRTVVGNRNYTYFLFVFNGTISKLGKICKDTTTSTLKTNHNAYEDVPIFCSHNGVIFTTAEDLIFWNDDLLVIFTDGTASIICRFTKLFYNFEISRIDRLKCPVSRQPKNKYFHNLSFSVCYNEIEKICKSPAGEDVSIILVLLLECRSK